ncbi:ATP-binding cassette domain-containing protein [Atopobacter phocae]|uniref:ATP-binding cassette domain-containing protein n=1 Tax=Atopobacter phocae TaxID=136492 RepID=UPI000470A8F9|nr:ATP-binding cassette domain-containing protein [Atopobacter phocae]
MLKISNWSADAADGTSVVKDVSIEIPRSSTLVLMGVTGAGKSTLLLSLSGLIPKQTGTVTPKIYPHDIGFLFQSSSLFPWMTAEENIQLGFHKQFLGREEVERQLRQVIDALKLGELIHRYPYQLSLGEAQRVALARIMAKHPPYLFLDEPTGRLDIETKQMMWHQLENMKKNNQVTTILVTHDIEEAVRLGDRIMVMSDGRITSDDVNPLSLDERKNETNANHQAFYQQIETILKQASEVME